LPGIRRQVLPAPILDRAQLEAAGWVMVWHVMANAMRSSNRSLMIPVFYGDP
jgi:hypothetical protein